MSDDFNAQIGRLDERMKGMEDKIDDLASKVDQIRAPKLWPIVSGVLALIAIIGGAGSTWVNMRLKPIEIEQARDAKDFQRLYDDFRALQKSVDGKADSRYVDDKIAYAYDRLKTEIKLKQQTP